MWGQVILVVLGALAAIAALALALLILPVRLRLELVGDNARVRYRVNLSPWPFSFSFRAISTPVNTTLVPADGQTMADKLLEILAKARRLLSVLSRSVAPRHRIIDFTVHLTFGVGDAAATAVIAGAAHAVVWTGARVLFSHAQRAPVAPDIVITPLYSSVGATLHVCVTVQLRPIGLLRSQGLWRAATRVRRHSS